MPEYVIRRLPPTVNQPGGGAAVMLGDRPVYCLPATIDDPLPRVLARCQQTADALNRAIVALDPAIPATEPAAWTPGWNDAPAPQPAEILAPLTPAEAADVAWLRRSQPDPIRRKLLIDELLAANTPATRALAAALAPPRQEPATAPTPPTPAVVAPQPEKAPTASPPRPATTAPLDF